MKTEHNQSINVTSVSTGLTKREWFAGIAMQGLLVNSYEKHQNPLSEANRHQIALLAVEQADALIYALNNNQR